MKNSRPDILSRPLFILALGLLLLNDFYLKYEFSNFLTGKLSDIAGIFLFPYFLSSLRIKWTKTIYLGTAFLFIYWKSPFSQDLINWWQTIGIGFNRVIDYTDLFALLILPLSFNYFQKQLLTERKISKYLTAPLGLISLLAIWATTLPREKVELNLNVNEVYEMQMSKAEFFNSIQAGVGSRRGISPLRSHRTVRESLPSYGSSGSATQIGLHSHGVTLIKTFGIIPFLVVLMANPKPAKSFAPVSFNTFITTTT